MVDKNQCGADYRVLGSMCCIFSFESGTEEGFATTVLCLSVFQAYEQTRMKRELTVSAVLLANLDFIKMISSVCLCTCVVRCQVVGKSNE